jgi:hypothetical protein
MLQHRTGRAGGKPIEIWFVDVAKRKELYEKAHPETKHGATLKRGKEKSPTSQSVTLAFIDDTAAKTGKHRAMVARDAKRGKRADLADVVGTSLDKGDELDALAELAPAQQETIIAKAKAGQKGKRQNGSKEGQAGNQRG